ncbi:MAG TPA: RnfH family protein [Casimicrobiaceae bacterium]|nr:RnfH family protein [Casimicrobiaceae bacterium]
MIDQNRDTIEVEVAYAGPEGESLTVVRLPAGSAIADAVAASGIIERFGLFEASLSYAIFGEGARVSTPLRPGDRVELLRPLIADVKDARRRRAEAKARPPSGQRSR